MLTADFVVPIQEVRSLIEIQREAEELQKLSDQANAKLMGLNNEFAKANVAETSNKTRIEVGRVSFRLGACHASLYSN